MYLNFEYHVAICRWSVSSKFSTWKLSSDLPEISRILLTPSFVTTVLAVVSIGWVEIQSACHSYLSNRTVKSQSFFTFNNENKFTLPALHPVFLMSILSSANDKLFELLILSCLERAPKLMSVLCGRHASQYWAWVFVSSFVLERTTVFRARNSVNLFAAASASCLNVRKSMPFLTRKRSI